MKKFTMVDRDSDETLEQDVWINPATVTHVTKCLDEGWAKQKKNRTTVIGFVGDGFITVKESLDTVLKKLKAE